jgi:hypothetical protein
VGCHEEMEARWDLGFVAMLIGKWMEGRMSLGRSWVGPWRCGGVESVLTESKYAESLRLFDLRI